MNEDNEDLIKKRQDGAVFYLTLNRPESGKKPRSSMSPTMVFDQEGNLKMILGY